MDYPITSILSEPRIIDIQSQILEAIAESKNISVILANDVEKAGHYIKNLNKLAKALEEERKKITAPLDEQKKVVMSFFKNLVSPIESEISRLDAETRNWLKCQREEQARREAEERRLAEEKAIAEAIAKEERLRAEAKERGEDPATVQVEVPIIAQDIPRQVKLSDFTSSGVTTMQVAKWRIIDFNLVPREYLCLDEAKITAIRKAAGTKNYNPHQIPGIEFYNEEVIRK
ncbi:MAG: hypothetical protein QXF70_03400 [Candidatus Bilamarchaeaceae archaeon]